ncbi:MAG TPA: redoxin domain-containing protein, partial [Thermoplasmata archaeon]|nr:redoxin domain-containing protein [Thermoplasmata archaeon]
MTWAARGAALTLLVVVAALAGAPVASADASPAPDFTIPLSDGTNFTLSEHVGKVVVLDFMYLDCPSCKIAESALKAVYWSYNNDSRYAGQVEIVSIDIFPQYIHNLTSIEAYRQRRGIPWPMGSDNAG